MKTIKNLKAKKALSTKKLNQIKGGKTDNIIIDDIAGIVVEDDVIM